MKNLKLDEERFWWYTEAALIVSEENATEPQKCNENAIKWEEKSDEKNHSQSKGKQVYSGRFTYAYGRIFHRMREEGYPVEDAFARADEGNRHPDG